ncbi:MAG TPA: class I SAM-dependent methyltransferase [Anaerolineales bacterium]|nr:class I SAM-dependent methyltransferase [Anaerolineales bacterium]
MRTTEIYSTKAEKYAKYRWDYSLQAIEAIIQIAHVTEQTLAADIGAGTGMLTKHFAGRVRHIYAVEPNDEMRKIAEGQLERFENCSVIKGCAEAIPLGNQSVDLITVAQALHWFDPTRTRAEFRRVLKPKGWLTAIRNYGVDQTLNQAMGRICAEADRAGLLEAVPHPEEKPVSYYCGHEDIQRLTYEIEEKQNWDEFIGSLLSASYMPEESHPSYPRLERVARQVFDDLSENGELRVRGETELIIGQVLF